MLVFCGTMKTPSPLPDEKRRIEVLWQYEVLDTPPEEAFDELTTLAADICEAPIALISLVDENRQWFKSRVGLTVTETARDISFCGHAIHQPGLFIVPDATLDERFADNPLVTSEPHIRFYAGAPLANWPAPTLSASRRRNPCAGNRRTSKSSVAPWRSKSARLRRCEKARRCYG